MPSLDEIANRLKMPSDVAGATLMAIGSSAPELFTALFAVFHHSGSHGGIGTGTIVGSAIFNILVIIGAVASFKVTRLTWQPVLRDMLFYVLSIVALLVVFWDGQIVMGESLIFIGLYILYIAAVVIWKKILPYKDFDPIDLVESNLDKNKLARITKQVMSYVLPDPVKTPKAYLYTFALSILGIAGLSYLMVESAVIIGHGLGINPTIIALTVLAAGTSIPDLVSSVVVAKQGRGDMAVANAVGSNIFDILIGLGLPWFLLFLVSSEKTLEVSTENLLSSIFLLGATVVVLLVLFVLRGWRIGKRAGLMLLGMYAAYVVYTIFSVIG